MSAIGNLSTYFQEVRQWCNQVLHMLYKREQPSAQSKELIYRVQLLLDRIEASHLHYDLSFMYDVSNEVDEIQRDVTILTEEHEGDVHQGYEDMRVEIGEHVLPKLPYAYNALEPYISQEIMTLHHTVHHKSYVEGLNKAERMMKEARQKSDYDLLKHWEREAAFHGSGHYLHTIFWNNMCRDGGGEAKGELRHRIQRDFGSYEKCREHFTEAANRVEGVGWALLVWSPRAHRLEILQSEKHQMFTQWDTIPLLVLDVWEHAYYLQYKAKRADYIKNWWNVVNWKDVSERYKKASMLKWQTY